MKESRMIRVNRPVETPNLGCYLVIQGSLVFFYFLLVCGAVITIFREDQDRKLHVFLLPLVLLPFIIYIARFRKTRAAHGEGKIVADKAAFAPERLSLAGVVAILFLLCVDPSLASSSGGRWLAVFSRLPH